MPPPSLRSGLPTDHPLPKFPLGRRDPDPNAVRSYLQNRRTTATLYVNNQLITDGVRARALRRRAPEDVRTAVWHVETVAGPDHARNLSRASPAQMAPPPSSDRGLRLRPVIPTYSALTRPNAETASGTMSRFRARQQRSSDSAACRRAGESGSRHISAVRLREGDCLLNRARPPGAARGLVARGTICGASFVFDHGDEPDLIENGLTGGAYRVMVGRAPVGNGPPKHIHPHTDEGFYIGEGEMTFVLAGREVIAGP